MNCRNGEKYLEKSLKSIISQSHKNWELIFWDNNSSDNSKKTIKFYLNSQKKLWNSIFINKDIEFDEKIS